MGETQIQVLEDAPATHVRAAEEIAHFAGEAICTHAEFNLCLTGGSTPAATYELLATRFRLSVDWKEVQFFWGDERCVPPADQASNFGMAQRTMLDKLGLRAEQIHRMRGEDAPERAALEYEDELRRHFSLEAGDWPRFDLVLLGLGANAHIASLFPGHPALHEDERLALDVTVEAEQPHRVTLTAPAINHAARVMFMVTGAEKASAVKAVLEGPRDPDQYPAQIVAPEDGELLWLMDRAAASLLTKSG
jgi:6-phosphogluconolactonase